MRVDFKGKQALVCASTKGLGYASALELAKLGASIIITGRSLIDLRTQKPK